jgi:hypothetical protein
VLSPDECMQCSFYIAVREASRLACNTCYSCVSECDRSGVIWLCYAWCRCSCVQTLSSSVQLNCMCMPCLVLSSAKERYCITLWLVWYAVVLFNDLG